MVFHNTYRVEKGGGKRIMRKHGILGLETVRVVIIFLLILAVTAIAVFLALTSLQNAGIFTANSQAANQTDQIIGNITTATTDFFANSSTFMVLLAVVVILLIVALVLVAVGRFGAVGAGGPRGGGL